MTSDSTPMLAGRYQEIRRRGRSTVAVFASGEREMPAPVVLSTDDTSTVRVAPRRLRLAAFLVDGSVILALLIGLIVLDLLSGLYGLWFIALFLAAIFVYYVAVSVWLTDGLTIGKALFNLTVRRVRPGSQLRGLRGLAWSVGRHSVGYVVLDVLGAGFLWSMVDSRRRCLHDLGFSSEVVVCWHEGELLTSPRTPRCLQGQGGGRGGGR